MPDITLPDDFFSEVARLMRLYRREAERCREAKAFLAGCALAAASLEATLLAFANCFPEEAVASPAAPRRHGAVKPMSKWMLADLLAVAKERNWLPSGLSLEEEWDAARAKIGDYAEVVRQVRNLVHPSRYAQEMPRKRITKRYLESCLNTLDTADTFLENRILASLHSLANEEKLGGA